jgi:enoyl-[acyl-carrier-protein] reductase (NADH)
MRTKLTENIDDRIIKAIEDLNPTKKLLTIEEVADTVYFLINCSQQVNGVNIVLNGGEHVI